MASPHSMSTFLSQSIGDFMALAEDAGLSERLVPALAAAAPIKDVCGITLTTHQNLAAHGAVLDDIERLRAHLAYFGLTLRTDPRDIVIPGRALTVF